ncbi:MAG: TolC family protein [Bacillota bacterium]
MNKNIPLWNLVSLLMLAVFLFSSALVLADTNQPITIAQAVEMALKNDCQIGIAGNDLEKAKLAVKQQIAQVFPQAKIDGLYEYDVNNQTYPHNYSIVISETIPTNFSLYGKKVVSNIDAAVWDQINSETQLQITKANVTFNTIQYYINALKAQQVLRMQQEVVKNALTANNLALEQLRLGKVTKTTQLQSENNLATASLDLEQDKADYEIALQQLGNQIGITDSNQIVLVDNTANYKAAAVDFEKLKEKAQKDRLELQQARIAVKKAELAWAQAANQGLPTVNLSYNNVDKTQGYSISYDFLSGNLGWNAAQRQNDSSVPDWNNNNNNTPYSSSNQKYYALEFTWNLDFGIVRSQAAQAKMALESANISQQQTGQKINLEVDQAIHDYKIAAQKVATNQKLVPYYQKDLEIKKLQNQLGVASTPLDVSTAELNLLKAQIAVVTAEYDQLVAYQKLRLVSGDLYPFGKKQ